MDWKKVAWCTMTLAICGCSSEVAFEGKIEDATIEDVLAWVDKGGAGGVDGLLDAMPARQLESFVWMHGSGDEHHASLEHPRVIAYGVDAHLLVAIGTDADDPRYNIVDLAEIDEETGRWTFRAVDAANGTYVDDDHACRSCHGDEPRPIWAGMGEWPGAFGADDDRVADGDREVVQRIRSNAEHRGARFALEAGEPYYWLAAREYPYPNTNLNLELGLRLAEGFHVRMRRSNTYPAYRDPLLLVSYCGTGRQNDLVERTRAWIDGWSREEVGDGISDTRNKLYFLMGVDPRTEWQIGALGTAPPSTQRDLPTWNAGGRDLRDLMETRLLFEILDEEPTIEAAMAPHLDSLRNVFHESWGLRGEERRTWLREHNPENVVQVTNDALDDGNGAARQTLCTVLAQRMSE